MVIFEKLYFTR